MSTQVESTPVSTSQGSGPDSSAASSAPASGSQSTPDTSSSSASSTSADPAQPPVSAPAAYTPNWKYKAAQKELELPEFIRAAVKDAATEKQVKELFEKTMAFDEFKTKNEPIKQRLEQFETKVLPQFKQLSDTVTEAMHYRDSGDYENLFKLLNLTDAKVAQHLIRKAQLRDAPPEQRAEYERQQEIQRQNLALQRENQRLSTQYQSTQVQSKSQELGSVLSRPEVQSAATAFDGRFGEGAFRQRVIREALLLEQLSGMDVSAEQAVTEVLKFMGPASQPGQASTQGQTASMPGSQPEVTATQGNANPQPPVIPNVGARGTSPTKKLPKSLDDIRKLHREMSEANKNRVG